MMKKINAKSICISGIYAVPAVLFCAAVLTACSPSKEEPQAEPEIEAALDHIHYEAKADYPFFEKEPELNKIIFEKVKEAHEEFYSEYYSAAENISSYGMFDFNVNYDKVIEENGYISFLISCSRFTGGAHGSSYLIPVNYNTAAKKNVSLEEAVSPASPDWLTALSDEARRQLNGQVQKNILNSDEAMINQGTEPKAENFEVFKLQKVNGEDCIRILFKQYQVAPYASGMPEIVIPLAFFK